MRFLFLAIVIVIAIIACRKDDAPDVDPLTACFDTTANTDSTLLAGRMLGSWKLQAQACPYGTNYPDVRVTFSSGRRYELKKDGDVVAQGTWHFVPSGSGWSLYTSEYSNYFFGGIYICQGKLVFSGLYLDGCNHYFKRAF